MQTRGTLAAARMLPPDTCSCLLPWRVMVSVMQICGCFPYRMSATGGTPTFSLPLCLWGVFLELFMFPVFWMFYRLISQKYLSTDLGTTALIYSCAVTFTIVTFTPFLLSVKSTALAALLHDLSGVQGVFPPPAHHWYCRPRTLAFVFSFMLLAGFLTYYSTTWKFEQFLEILPIFFATWLYTVNMALPNHLSSMLFGLLARRLEASTEATVAMVSSLLAPDGSFKCRSDVKAAMVAMRDLDAVILEVEGQRETGVRCFFPVITLYLQMSVLLAIVCPYGILTGTILGGTTVVVLLFGYFIMFSFCHVGQTFINKVIAAEGLLKDLRAKSQNYLLTMKVSQVMGSLSPMLTFNMRGWYRLDYASFLLLMNTVLTYVVIIFQVGGNNFANILVTSAQQNNSTAFK